jgi:hypothetical protein
MLLQHSGAFDSVGAELLDGSLLEQRSGRRAQILYAIASRVK